jgi:hypothetical protein
MIARKDEDVPGLLRTYGIDVLIDGVSGAEVPVFTDALHGRQDLDEVAEFPGDH